MSDYSQGPGWWQASDGKWYPPQPPTPPPSPWGAPGPGASPYGSSPTGPSPYAAMPYQVYGQPTGPALPSVQGMAVASMVLGIIGIVLILCWYISVVCAVIGLPLGLVALSRIRKGAADPGPKGMAIAGIACSSVALTLSIGLLVLFFSVRSGSSGY